MFGPVFRKTLLGAFSLWVAAAVAGCDKAGPAAPEPVGNIAFRPVADVRVDKITSPSTVVVYPAPIADGGIAPLTVGCLPASGSVFPVGTTVVTCTATDGVRFAETHFSVVVVAVPAVIGVTRFVAFGDSITNGEVQTNPTILVVDRNVAYPTVLKGLLEQRYPTQTFTVFNAGASGEQAQTGNLRIGSVLAAQRPQALLLLQGVLDIGQGPDKIPHMIGALQTSIQIARNQGVPHIFLSTLTPQKDPYPGYPDNNHAMLWIDAANVEIRALASREGVYLVDAYAAMVGQVSTLIGGDGLHPTAQGFAVLAQTFFNVIKDKLELPPGSAAPASVNGLLLRPGEEIRSQSPRQPVRIRQRQQ